MSGIEEQEKGKVCIFDGDFYQIRISERYKRYTECPVCNTARVLSWYLIFQDTTIENYHSYFINVTDAYNQPAIKLDDRHLDDVLGYMCPENTCRIMRGHPFFNELNGLAQFVRRIGVSDA